MQFMVRNTEYAVLLPKLRRWHGLYTDRLRPSIVFNFNYKKQKKSKLGTLFSLKFIHHTCSPISLHRRQTCSKLTTCGLVSRRAVSSRKKRIRGSGEPLDHIFVPRPTQPWTKSVPLGSPAVPFWYISIKLRFGCLKLRNVPYSKMGRILDADPGIGSGLGAGSSRVVT